MLTQEIIVDNFAGGGGASTGIELATGRSPEIAINHDLEAIAMHEANHPESEHYCESVWDVNPIEAVRGRPVGLAWFSPDCKHFSKAKGGTPVKKEIRGLAWVAMRWADTVRPRVIMIENVEEFQTWGPVIPQRDSLGRMLKRIPSDKKKGKDLIVSAAEGEIVPIEQRVYMPDPKRKGQTFRHFVHSFREKGYDVEWRELKACDYGAPTTRKRLFLIARCDGKPIVWPEPTHGAPDSLEVRAGKRLPWRTAAEIIDWSIPCRSIFGREKPLAENTMKRIFRGLQKFVIDNPDPYVIDPFVIRVNFAGSNHHYCDSIQEPLKTITAKNGWGLVTPYIARIGQTGFGGDRLQYKTTDPLTTVTTKAEHLLVTSHLVKMRGTNMGQSMDKPIQTITAGGTHFGEVRAFLLKYYGDAENGQAIDQPLHTVTTKDRFGLITIHGEDYQIVDIRMRMLEPRELFGGQGFPKNYIIDVDANGKKYSKRAQVARCGNAVPPPFAEVLVRANTPELCTGSGNHLSLERYTEQEEGQLAFSM
ncbi:DNA cytosine methyltransferase [Paenibacillus hubeiensis]|uniref:DNA cytosine methyltransferase n=1 Tax=Paenibacillus hubeiensis TaxID=3077330 RepID=UPI0031BBA6F4